MRTCSRIPPDGWFEEFFDKANLGRSYELLEGLDHFYAATLRGRIRSLQLRTAEAWEHFDEAVELARAAPSTIANLVRQVLLHLYLFEERYLVLEGSSSLAAVSAWMPSSSGNSPGTAIQRSSKQSINAQVIQ